MSDEIPSNPESPKIDGKEAEKKTAGTSGSGDGAEMADWGEALKEQQNAEAAKSSQLDAWADALSEQKAQVAPKKESETIAKGEPPNAKVNTLAGEFKRADLEKFGESAGFTNEEAKNLDVVLDIPVTISMEVGKTEISIRNLMKLNQGSVVELDRFAGESLDVFVNGTLIAHGEVVVVNEKFGIRLTDVISAQERISKLG